MNKNKKLFIICFIISILLSFFIGNLVIKADSGFDSDWDSGSSWSSSDWDSGSSWSSSDWGSSSNSSSDPRFAIIFLIIVIVIIIMDRNDKKRGIISKTNRIVDQNLINKIKENIPNFESTDFLDETYEVFKNVQNAWMNFDYDNLRKYLTDELFNTYNMQLKTLSTKKQKNIMYDFTLIDNIITDFYKTEKEYVIKTHLSVSFYDYLTDKDDKVIRGNSKRKINIEYELTFIRSISEKENKCPNCNAQLPNTNSNYCTYCGSRIVSNNHGWILSKKESIKQY